MSETDEILDGLRARAHAAAERAHVPYSGRSAGAVLLLSDGSWVPGVRVESASFSLLIPELVNAFSTAVAAARRDVAAAVLSRPATAADQAFLQDLPGGPFTRRWEDAFVHEPAGRLPALQDELSPFLEAPVPESPAAGIRLARRVAERAYTPASGFQVGCVLQAGSGLIPGVNVEQVDWSRTLCAERNALGTAVSYGITDLRNLYLTCVRDPAGSPCGACRQLLAELAPEAVLWMDRGSRPPEAAQVAELLPGFFTGQALTRSG